MPKQSGRSSATGRARKGTASTDPRSSSAKGSGRKSAARKSATSKAASASRTASEAQEASDAAAREALRESDKLYYRIGEVSRLTGVKAHVLRYWETEFRWMAPPKSRSKQRLYRKRDIEFVWLLKRLLWNERYTIAGARQRIQDLGVDEALALLDQPLQPAGTAANEGESKSSAEWAPPLLVALEEMQAELLDLRSDLQDGA